MKSLLPYVLLITTMFTGVCLTKTLNANGNELRAVKFTGKEAQATYLEQLSKASVSYDTRLEKIKGRDVITGPKSIFAPKRAGSYFLKKTLRCDYVDVTNEEFDMPGGLTQKFLCRDDGKYGSKIWKVKYTLPQQKRPNAEVFTEVAANRLLWMLGLYSDTTNPVKVECKGCPEDPWFDYYKLKKTYHDRDTTRVFTFATVEEKLSGEEFKHRIKKGEVYTKGFMFKDFLNDSDARSQIKNHFRFLLASVHGLLYSTDTKAGNQKLICISNQSKKESKAKECKKIVAYTKDLGFSFGGHDITDIKTSKANYEYWINHTLIDSKCVIDTHIIGGRGIRFQLTKEQLAFVSKRFQAISRSQWIDLYTVSQFFLFKYATPDGMSKENKIETIPKAWADLTLEKIASLNKATNCK